jgi:GNAT superfamily N-acetyltransferase
MSDYLSPENFVSSLGKTAGNYLPPEFLEFLRAELLRCGKALRTVPALEHENADMKEQAHLAATAQFFYALGLLYTRGIIIPPEVSGASSRAEEQSPATTCEVFGEALERFAREQFQGRGIGRELGELSEKARLCFRALAPESEQLERVRDENIRLNRKKAVNA